MGPGGRAERHSCDLQRIVRKAQGARGESIPRAFAKYSLDARPHSGGRVTFEALTAQHLLRDVSVQPTKLTLHAH